LRSNEIPQCTPLKIWMTEQNKVLHSRRYWSEQYREMKRRLIRTGQNIRKWRETSTQDTCLSLENSDRRISLNQHWAQNKSEQTIRISQLAELQQAASATVAGKGQLPVVIRSIVHFDVWQISIVPSVTVSKSMSSSGNVRFTSNRPLIPENGRHREADSNQRKDHKRFAELATMGSGLWTQSALSCEVVAVRIRPRVAVISPCDAGRSTVACKVQSTSA
jgi:hypothetical protein